MLENAVKLMSDGVLIGYRLFYGGHALDISTHKMKEYAVTLRKIGTITQLETKKVISSKIGHRVVADSYHISSDEKTRGYRAFSLDGVGGLIMEVLLNSDLLGGKSGNYRAPYNMCWWEYKNATAPTVLDTTKLADHQWYIYQALLAGVPIAQGVLDDHLPYFYADKAVSELIKNFTVTTKRKVEYIGGQLHDNNGLTIDELSLLSDEAKRVYLYELSPDILPLVNHLYDRYKQLGGIYASAFEFSRSDLMLSAVNRLLFDYSCVVKKNFRVPYEE